MLSGIGPADHLRSLGIDVVADLPRSAPACRTTRSCRSCGTPREKAIWEGVNLRNLMLWQSLPRAVLERRRGGRLHAYVSAAGARPAVPRAPHAVRERGADRHGDRMMSVRPHPGRRGQPRRHHAAFRRPAPKPLIDPAYLQDPADLEVLLAGVRQAREIAAAGRWRGSARGSGRPVRARADLARLGPPRGRHAVPPDRHLRDGRRLDSRSATRSCGYAGSTV